MGRKRQHTLSPALLLNGEEYIESSAEVAPRRRLKRRCRLASRRVIEDSSPEAEQEQPRARTRSQSEQPLVLESDQVESTAEELEGELWTVTAILEEDKENGLVYIQWEPHPVTGETYPLEWIERERVTPAALEDWDREQEIRQQQEAESRQQRQNQERRRRRDIYDLSSSSEPEFEPEPVVNRSSPENQSVPQPVDQPIKRKRGRPRKYPAGQSAPAKEPKKRGRPRKHELRTARDVVQQAKDPQDNSIVIEDSTLSVGNRKTVYVDQGVQTDLFLLDSLLRDYQARSSAQSLRPQHNIARSSSVSLSPLALIIDSPDVGSDFIVQDTQDFSQGSQSFVLVQSTNEKSNGTTTQVTETSQSRLEDSGLGSSSPDLGTSGDSAAIEIPDPQEEDNADSSQRPGVELHTSGSRLFSTYLHSQTRQRLENNQASSNLELRYIEQESPTPIRSVSSSRPTSRTQSKMSSEGPTGSRSDQAQEAGYLPGSSNIEKLRNLKEKRAARQSGSPGVSFSPHHTAESPVRPFTASSPLSRGNMNDPAVSAAINLAPPGMSTQTVSVTPSFVSDVMEVPQIKTEEESFPAFISPHMLNEAPMTAEPGPAPAQRINYIPDTPSLDANEYVVALPMDGRIKDEYESRIVEERRSINKYLSRYETLHSSAVGAYEVRTSAVTL